MLRALFLSFIMVSLSFSQPASLCLKMVDLDMEERAIKEGETLLKMGQKSYYTYMCLVEAYMDMRDYPLALKYAKRMQEKAKSQLQAFYARIKLGEINFLLRNYPEAVEHYRSAVSIAESMSSEPLEILALRRLAEVYTGHGDYNKALKIYFNLSNKVEHEKAKLDLLEKLADVLVAIKRYDEAVNALNLMLELSQQFRDFDTLARTYINLGDLYRRKGEYDVARENFKRGAQTAESIGNRTLQALAYEQMGAMDIERLNIEEARKNLQIAYQLYKQEKRSRDYRRVAEKIEFAERLSRIR